MSHSLLTCLGFAEKSAYGLMGFLLSVMSFFSLAACKSLFVFDFSKFYYNVSQWSSFGLNLYGDLWVSCTWMSTSLSWFVFSAIIYLSKLSAPFSLSSPCGPPTLWILFPLMTSHNWHRLSSVIFLIWFKVRFFPSLIKLAIGVLYCIFYFIHCVLQVQNLIFFFSYLRTVLFCIIFLVSLHYLSVFSWSWLSFLKAVILNSLVVCRSAFLWVHLLET